MEKKLEQPLLSSNLRERSLDLHRIFQKILWIIPLGILGNILFSVLTTDRSILDSLKSFSIKYLILAIFLGLIPWFTNTFRVIIWTRFLGKRFKFSEIFSIILGAELGSAISPTAIGGGYVKLGMLYQKGFSAGKATSLTLLGSLEEFFFFILSSKPLSPRITSKSS